MVSVLALEAEREMRQNIFNFLKAVPESTFCDLTRHHLFFESGETSFKSLLFHLLFSGQPFNPLGEFFMIHGKVFYNDLENRARGTILD